MQCFIYIVLISIIFKLLSRKWMFLPPVLDPISREFLWSQNDLYCKNTFWAWIGQGITKLICCKFLYQERMKLIIDQINPCDLVLKKALQNVSRSLDSNPVILRKLNHAVSLLTFWPYLLVETISRK